MLIPFCICAAVALVATLRVITERNAVHALLYFIVSLLSVGLIFFILGAGLAAQRAPPQPAGQQGEHGVAGAGALQGSPEAVGGRLGHGACAGACSKQGVTDGTAV